MTELHVLVSIELVSSSARVALVKSQQGGSVSQSVNDIRTQRSDLGPVKNTLRKIQFGKIQFAKIHKGKFNSSNFLDS